MTIINPIKIIIIIIIIWISIQKDGFDFRFFYLKKINFTLNKG